MRSNKLHGLEMELHRGGQSNVQGAARVRVPEGREGRNVEEQW